MSGQLTYGFNMPGLDKSVSQLKEARKSMLALRKEQLGNLKAQKAIITSYTKEQSVVGQAIKGAQNLGVAIGRLNVAISTNELKMASYTKRIKSSFVSTSLSAKKEIKAVVKEFDILQSKYLQTTTKIASKKLSPIKSLGNAPSSATVGNIMEMGLPDFNYDIIEHFNTSLAKIKATSNSVFNSLKTQLTATNSSFAVLKTSANEFVASAEAFPNAAQVFDAHPGLEKYANMLTRVGGLQTKINEQLNLTSRSGMKKSKKALSEYRAELNKFATKLEEVITNLSLHKRALLLQKEAVKSSALSAKDQKIALKSLNSALRKNALELSDAKEEYGGYKNAVNKSTAAIKRITTALSGRFIKGLKSASSSVSKYSKRIHDNVKAHRGWWDSFGRVAIGFGIAYRAINAFEFAVSELTASFRNGLTAMDEYIKSTATVSGMLSLLYTGGSYKERFEDFSSVMGATMRETMRIMPKYRLSIEEVGDAYKELAQFGVIVAPKDVDKTLISLSAIKEIAVTTGSSSKQIRQELQAVFNGSKRITDQYGRFLARFPELEKDIYGINKLTTSNAEKWRLATNAIANYGLAIKRANDTVGTQKEIITNTLQIISMDSLKLTGVYDKWLKKIKEISTLLIKNNGELGTLGKKVTNWFGIGWQVIDKVAQGLVSIFKTTKENLTPFKNFIRANWDLVSSMIQLSIGIKVANLAFGGLYRGFMLLFKWPLLIAGGVIFLKNELTAFGLVNFADLKTHLLAIKLMFKDITDSVKSFLGIVSNPGIWKSVYDLADAKNVFTSARVGYDPVKKFFGVSREEAKAEAIKFVAEQRKIMRGFGNTKAPDDVVAGYWYNDEINVKNLMSLYDKYAQKTRVVSAKTKEFNTLMSKAWKGTVTDVKDFTNQLLAVTTGMSKEEWTDIKLDFGLDSGVEASAKRIAELMTKYQMPVNDTFESIKNKSKETWQYVSDGFSTYFTSIVSGEITSFSDLWKLTITTMRDTWAQAMSDMATDTINKFFREVAVQSKSSGTSFLGTAIKAVGNGLLGYFGSSASGVSDMGGVGDEIVAQNTYASGGIIPEPVVGIGASGQTYTFAERGPERVLSNSDSFSSPNPTAITVEVINKSSQPVKGKQGSTRMDIKGMVTQIVLEDIAMNGPMARARGMA